MITQCCIHELYLEGSPMQPAVDLAKTFERRKCNHREPIPGDDCISSVVGALLYRFCESWPETISGESNKHRYIVSAQSQPLRAKLRMVPAVPLLHVNRGVLILEPPSDATLKAKQAVCILTWSVLRAVLPFPRPRKKRCMLQLPTFRSSSLLHLNLRRGYVRRGRVQRVQIH